MNTNIINYFKCSSLTHPDNVALEDSNQEYTYEELTKVAFNITNSAVLKYALGLPVVVFIPKSMKAVASILATLMTGNIYCPIDVNAPADRIQKIIDNLGSCIILHTAATESKLDQLTINKELVLLSNVDTYVEFVIKDNLVQIWQKITINTSSVISRDPCYIIFTSGSTGTPKGVTICHENVFDYIDWANLNYDVTSKDNIGSQAPFFFDNSTLDLYLTFSNGAKLTLIPEGQFIFPKRLIDYLNEKQITTIFWVPSLLVNIANLDLLANNKLPALRNVFFAGEVMPAKQIKYWLKHHPKANYSNLYGPTEITVDCTFFDVPTNWNGTSLPIGIPCQNSSVLILDENDKLAEFGELCVKGTSVALGYWKDTEKTEKVFVQNPLHTDYRDIIYKTGDIVKLIDGLIYFIGRKDFQIKHNGYRIELGEIESVVSKLSGIDLCVAGYILETKTLYLVIKSSVFTKDVQLIKVLMKLLPKYMIPSYFKFVPELPLTSNGKLNRLTINEIIKDELQND